MGSIARGSGGRVTGLLALATACRETVEYGPRRQWEIVRGRSASVAVAVLLAHPRAIELARRWGCASQPSENEGQLAHPRCTALTQAQTSTDDRGRPGGSVSARTCRCPGSRPRVPEPVDATDDGRDAALARHHPLPRQPAVRVTRHAAQHHGAHRCHAARHRRARAHADLCHEAGRASRPPPIKWLEHAVVGVGGCEVGAVGGDHVLRAGREDEDEVEFGAQGDVAAGGRHGWGDRDRPVRRRAGVLEEVQRARGAPDWRVAPRPAPCAGCRCSCRVARWRRGARSGRSHRPRAGCRERRRRCPRRG